MNYITVIKGSEILTEKFDSYTLEGDIFTTHIMSNGSFNSKDFLIKDIHAVFYKGEFRKIENVEVYEMQEGFIDECYGDGSMSVEIKFGEEGKEEEVLRFDTNKEDLENDLRMKLDAISMQMKGKDFYCYADVTEVTGYNLLDSEKVISPRLV